MKLTVLGNNGPYPAAGGACSGYLISSDSGNTQVLIECGAGVLANLLRHLPCNALDAVILSHLHYDHMSDLLPMQYALQFNPRSQPLPILAPASPDSVAALLKSIPAFELRHMENTRIGELSFSFFPVRHPVETYAIRAEESGRSFVYTGDTNEAKGLAEFARGADLLLADAGLSCADWHGNAPHLSAQLCGKLAQEAACTQLLLTHLNPKYAPQALESEARALRPDAEFTQIGAQYVI